MAQNPLLSTQNSDLHVALHPLPLLNISDYITRHTLRQQKGALVGALLGQQNGREITVEHAFECKVDGGDLDDQWFVVRLQQMKDVHKSPALDLVGWYTIVPNSGPQQYHVTLQTQLYHLCPEATILLGFHPEAVIHGSVGGKLPLTIYEANIELPETGVDVEMTDGQSSIRVAFKELPYSIETGEAEMIGIDFVARGGGNATAVEGITDGSAAMKGKKKHQTPEPKQGDNHHVLSPEEEELVASLTAKVNAIKMLHARINLITAYLENLPPSFVTGNAAELPDDANKDHVPTNHSIIRSIQALLNRLALLIPSDKVAFSQELLAEQNDVNLVTLLSHLTESIKESRELGRKFTIVDSVRSDKKSKASHPAWSPSSEVGRSLGGSGDLML